MQWPLAMTHGSAGGAEAAAGEVARAGHPARNASCRLRCRLGMKISCRRSTSRAEYSNVRCVERRRLGRGGDAAGAEAAPAPEWTAVASGGAWCACCACKSALAIASAVPPSTNVTPGVRYARESDSVQLAEEKHIASLKR